MPILSCPGCARGGLRVPDGKRGKVTCPTCGAEWFYPEEIELSEVSFRCARSGAHFSVILSRRSKQHPFVIEKIRRPMPAAESPLGQSAPVTSKSMVDPESASMRLRGSLTRLLDRFVGSSSPPAMSSGGSSSPVESVSPGDQHDAGDYNWSGFSCPYCGDVSFVRCSGGHLVCQGTTEVRNDRRFHRCFCGGAGYIEGRIESFHDRRQSFERAATPKRSEPIGGVTSEQPAATALPAPQGKGSIAKR
jgi:predicted RNA-binding Zn-ribbon protein involved in translation (DUF1610 family)